MPKKNRTVTEDDKLWFKLGQLDGQQQSAKRITELEAQLAAVHRTQWHEECSACETASIRLRVRNNLLEKQIKQLRRVNHHLWEILVAADQEPLCKGRAIQRKVVVNLMGRIKANRKKKPK